MRINISRGFTRIWIGIVGLAELAIMAVAVNRVISWYNENPFDRFDTDYVSLWQRIQPLAIAMTLAVMAGYAIWFVVRWIAQGFSD